MLRLSKKADYALIAMKHLAQKDGATSTCAREIAEQYDIPLELMAKVLQRLVRSRLLVSTQGTRGGYTLSRSSNSISVADVIEAIDGPFTVTACTTDKHDCELGRVAVLLFELRELGREPFAQTAPSVPKPDREMAKSAWLTVPRALGRITPCLVRPKTNSPSPAQR